MEKCSDKIAVSFCGDFGYELSQKQRDEFVSAAHSTDLTNWSALDVAFELYRYVYADYVRTISPKEHRIIKDGYTMATVYAL